MSIQKYHSWRGREKGRAHAHAPSCMEQFATTSRYNNTVLDVVLQLHIFWTAKDQLFNSSS